VRVKKAAVMYPNVNLSRAVAVSMARLVSRLYSMSGLLSLSGNADDKRDYTLIVGRCQP
jgi:acetate kinase